MKKKIRISSQGHRADIGEYIIYRMLPNRYTQAVGPFVFLDHVPPAEHSPDEPIKKANGSGAHPHRGIATLTYLLHGEADHLDSKGHHAKVGSGGVQWMKAGNGIIHDEVVNVDPRTNDRLTHAFQFWIALPAKNKAEPPDYLPVQGNEVPQRILSDERGWVKVLVGEYEGLASKIPNYSKQFLYHVQLAPGKQFSVVPEKGLEYAVFLPLHDAVINDGAFKGGDLIDFDGNEGTIDIDNPSENAIDILIFGGEPYTEPIVAQGPFVMNSAAEVAVAYRDFHAGKYGVIDYHRQN
jgi:redox-sensitive bicupin YhaK (pirin superfamily)